LRNEYSYRINWREHRRERTYSLKLPERFKARSIGVRSIVCVCTHSFISIKCMLICLKEGLIFWVEIRCKESTLIVDCSYLFRAVSHCCMFGSEFFGCFREITICIGDKVIPNRTWIHEIFSLIIASFFSILCFNCS